ncbi:MULTISPECIES: tyrosine-type recombinase/integrase [Hyphomicrobiales]|uniref:Tyrosine-type recombinase/integrase n=1 Tax=Bosea massiliensis TaxID=151419 RepID=A0ABW0P9T0_9HYPH|nr:tyrosine-type recombinase/integrase [Methylobacterium sp. CCH7-A2]
MTDLATTMSRSEAEQRVRIWVDVCSERFEADLSASGGYAYFSKAEADQMGSVPTRELDDLFRIIGDTVVRPREKQAISAALSGRDPEAASSMEPIIGGMMKVIAPATDRASPDGQLLARTMLRGLAAIAEERSRIAAGEIAPIPPKASGPWMPKKAKPMPAAPFLSHWNDFEASKLSNGLWKADTASNGRSSRKLFQELVGNKPAADIDRAQVSEFRRLLFALPKFYDKAKCWRGMPLREVIQDAKVIDDTRPPKAAMIPRLKVKTVDKHTGNLIEYWNWCQINGRLPKEAESPFTGFIQPKPKGKQARHERKAWPPAMVETLFTSPVWTGSKSFHRRATAGTMIFKDARFWVPLLGRHTGAREDEICSLKVGDIIMIDGIACLSIRDSKTPESDRDLPIPEALLRMGFLEYRYWGRAADEPLFPELIPQGVGSRRSAAFSGWFTEYRRGIDCYVLLVDFHSFRHNVSTDLQNMPGLNLGWADEITGHDSGVRSSERSRYSKGVFMKHLKTTLDAISIGVDLDHLNYHGARGEPAPGAAEDRAMFVAVAERDMKAKAGRRRAGAPHA